jgi:hypothetical protein
MTSRIWTPLDRGRREIRLAYLAPSAKRDEQPSCSLHIVSLDDNPHYEALSYTWGNPKVTEPIQLRSVQRESGAHVKSDAASDYSLDLRAVTSLHPEVSMLTAIKTVTRAVELPVQKVPELSPSAENETYAQWPVTTNLEAALRYLRHESMVRILWIDAICIDQSNIEERNHQVPLMKTIYSNATTVRVWLGNPTTGSDDAIVILKEIGQGVPLQEIKIQGRIIHDDDIKTMIELMNRPWWNRTWVQQELLLAKRAVFHCGFSWFEWSDMPSTDDFNLLIYSIIKSHRFNEDLQSALSSSLVAKTRIQNMAKIHKGAEYIEEHFAYLLVYGRLCLNSDDRDSIYGFLGLMSEHIASRINPDYNMSVADVFQDATIQLTACSQSLVLFSLTQYTTIKNRRNPTWVPVWHALTGLEAMEWSNRALRLTRYAYFSACAGHPMKLEVIGRSFLKLSGAQLDQVQIMGSVTMPEDSTMENILEQHQEWRLLCGLDIHDHSRYIAGGKASDGYWKTLINDIYTDMAKKGEPRRRCQTRDHKAYLEWLHELKDSASAYWESDLTVSFHYSFREACSGRRFFVTKKGYFGIGPAELEEGDEIYILAGGKLPFVLRPLPESQPDTFELVSDCYVHGIMDGEAVSGHGSGRVNRWKKAVVESFTQTKRDPDLPLRDFHDVFLV